MRTISLLIAVLLGVLTFSVTCFAAQALTPQKALVAKLYKNYAFEAIRDESDLDGEFLDRPRNVLLSYLTPSLAKLVLKDRKCAADTHEICNLDFMPLWDSQDPTGAIVRILPTSKNDEVNVQLRYGSETRTLTYFLTLTNLGWRIRDIAYENGRKSLVDILGRAK
ncbi:hypothetical protein [Undibacterium sp. Ji22W]|uniref:hypothetical protein n=1 Tax=Undibacterium sp. Ji22W TaxID=3413038 RepID=UPI003BF33910